MFESVKKYLNEVLEIAAKCPDKYQAKCFEILLDALVRGEAKAPPGVVSPPASNAVEASKAASVFFSQHNISEDQWKRVFNFDGTQYAIIVKDLKDKTKAGKQVKLGLLLGIETLLETGTPDITKDLLIEKCKHYACHDSTNFSSNMKRLKNLFLTKGKGWVLTVPGQEKAAEVILELAQ